MHECSSITVVHSTYTPRSLLLLLSCWCISGLVWANPIPTSISTEPAPTATVPPPNSTKPLASSGVHPSNPFTMPHNWTEPLFSSSTSPSILTTPLPYTTSPPTSPVVPPPIWTVPSSNSSSNPSFVAELLDPDENTELNTTSRSAIMVDYDAKKFLQIYGYMPTYNPLNGKWEYTTGPKVPWEQTLAVASLALNVTSKTPPETSVRTVDKNESFIKVEQRKFENAIKEFQRRYSLQVTGSVDEDTLRVMQQPRCGVPDYTDKVEDTKMEPKKATLAVSLASKMDVEGSKSPSQAPVNNDSRTLTGTLVSKSSFVLGDRSTVSSPATKVATRTRQSTLAGEASEISGPISLSDLLTQTIRPQDDGEVSTDNVNIEEDELITAAPVTTSVAPVTTPLLGEATVPRPRRNVGEDRAKIRTKRQEYTYDGYGNDSITSYTKTRITWRILNDYFSSHFTETNLRSKIARAFRRWAEKLPLVFVEMRTGDLLRVDIKIAFVGSSNSYSHFHFRYADGELARTVSRHYIFFNEDIQWTCNTHQGTNLIKVAVHEVGHILGLGHKTNPYSTMYAIYQPFRPSDGHFRVSIDDESVTLAQNIHGLCTGSFDTVLDWVRTVDNKRKYSTVFFRGDRVWIYENANERVKFGYPRNMSSMWSGIPTHVDAALQILPSDNLYFFKGDKYYQFDNVNRVAMTRDPETNADISNGRLISDGWPAKPGFPRIPDGIDTAYFDRRDGNVYFFKGNMVYAYDMQVGGCCLDGYPRSISLAYPHRDGGNEGLHDNIDAAYYSFYHRNFYYFKGDLYWENDTDTPSVNIVDNRVLSSLMWNQNWHDICEV